MEPQVLEEEELAVPELIAAWCAGDEDAAESCRVRRGDEIVHALRERHGDDGEVERETHDFLEQMERLGVLA